MNRTPVFVDLPTDDINLVLRCKVYITPGSPGQLLGPPEKCYPPEDREVEIDQVHAVWCGSRQTALEVSSLLALLGADDKLQSLVETALAEQNL
jgi:hypothetical protein